MQYRRLDACERDVSTVALGCWALVGGFNWGEQDRADSIATIRAAVEAGINFFDTAPGYGNGASEELVGELLEEHDDVVIATKVGPGDVDPSRLVPACEASLKRLRRERIDLYQIHWPNHDVPIEDTMAALVALRDQGKIAAIGVSNFGPLDLAEAIDAAPIATHQPAYNLLFRAIEFEVQPMCVEHGIGILCYSPIAQGMLTGKFTTADAVPQDRARTRHFSHRRPQTRHDEVGCEAETFDTIRAIRDICADIDLSMGDVALTWCLHQPAVTSVLAGARNPQQVRENARAADLLLDDDVIRRLNATTDALKASLGPSIDCWMAPEARVR